MSDDRFKGMEGIDSVTQLQIEDNVKNIQRATAVDIAITIVVKDDAIQCAVRMGGQSEADAKADSLHAMIVVAAGSLEQVTGGNYKLVIQGPDGKITDALPDAAMVRIGTKFG